VKKSSGQEKSSDEKGQRTKPAMVPSNWVVLCLGKRNKEKGRGTRS